MTNDHATIFPMLHELVRNELDEIDARAAAAHAAACAACAAELDEIRRADAVFGSIRHDDAVPGMDDLKLAAMRRRVFAEVREAEARVERQGFGGLRYGLAAAAAALLVVGLGIGLRSGGDVRSGEVARLMDGAAGAADKGAEGDDLGVVTVASDDGVRLLWHGKGKTYRVLKSRRPGDFADAEVTVVCGTTWTDRAAAAGVVFYRVLPAEEPCHT